MIIAIDGPAGAGKSSVSAAVAERLGFQRIDTGALYRCVALEAIRNGVALDDESALGGMTAQLEPRFVRHDGEACLFLGDENVTDAIRAPEVSSAASRVSSLPAVRAALLDLQRELGRSADTLMDGRDIGTVIFPDADLKVFLTASVEARASRRVKEDLGKGRAVTLESVMADIQERDDRDMNRPVAPLRKAEDAIEVDTTSMAFEEVVLTLLKLVREKRENTAH